MVCIKTKSDLKYA
jgi:mannosyltransferase